LINTIEPPTQHNPFSVSTLNRVVRLLLEEGFDKVWVEGEVSNLSQPASGHVYFSLKDVNAQIRCACFRAQLRGKPALSNGQQIVCRGRLSLYEARGDYQLIVDQFEPIGDGALRKAFEILKEKLDKEGLLDTIHKKNIPVFPQCIGVVTSPTGAAIQDILHVLQRRFPSIPVLIYPTLVQGNEAAAQIVRALQLANRHQACDVLIVARGGGSLEDLWPFNEEIVARAIFASQIPIVSGVGHEVDVTMSDLVADVRAPTPSAAAELISPDSQQYMRVLQQLEQRLISQLQQYVRFASQRLEHLQHRLQQQHPKQQLQQKAQQLDDLSKRLHDAIQRQLEQSQIQWQQLSRALHTLSPLATLHRGYAIVKNKAGHVIRQPQDVTQNERLFVQLQGGEIICRVETSDTLS